ncbi:MAG: hypothetical protein AABY64_06825 [Bdellovibrionota bacterium]
MNVIKRSLVEIQTLKSDLQFPEFPSPTRAPGKSIQVPLAWSIGDQLISGFTLSKGAQALSIPLSDTKSNVDYFYEVNPKLSVPQVCFLINSPVFSTLFDTDYFFSCWGKGQKENLSALATSLITFPMELLCWIHEKDVGVQDLAPLKAISFEQIHHFIESFLKTRPSKTEGVQILELVVDLTLLGTSQEEILSAMDGGAHIALKNLKVLRYPNTMDRDQDLKGKLLLSWPSNIQTKFQRRGDRAGFDLQLFVSSSTELKKTVNHLEKVVEEWKSLSQNR